MMRRQTEEKKNVKLLIVDENSSYYEQLKDCAEMCAHEFNVECIHATSAQEAMKIIESEHPTVLLVDAYLPDLTNAKLISKCSEGVVPVVITSDYQLPELEEVTQHWGADEYIPKSDNPDDVEEALRRIVELAMPFVLVQ